MKKTVVSTAAAPAAIGPYSQAIAAENLVFVSGQLGLNGEGRLAGATVEEQTRQALLNLQAILTEAGSSLEQVVKTTVFLTDMDDFAAMNKIYGTFFPAHPPARSAIQVVRLPKDGEVEIEAIAVKG